MSRLDPSLEPNGSGLRRIEVITGLAGGAGGPKGRRRWQSKSRWLLTRSSRTSRVDMALRHSNCSPGEGRRAGGQRRRAPRHLFRQLRRTPSPLCTRRRVRRRRSPPLPSWRSRSARRMCGSGVMRTSAWQRRSCAPCEPRQAQSDRPDGRGPGHGGDEARRLPQGRGGFGGAGARDDGRRSVLRRDLRVPRQAGGPRQAALLGRHRGVPSGQAAGGWRVPLAEDRRRRSAAYGGSTPGAAGGPGLASRS